MKGDPKDFFAGITKIFFSLNLRSKKLAQSCLFFVQLIIALKSSLVLGLDRYLEETYPEFFGRDSQHPYLKIKPYKVIHDNLWGTNQFSWCELAVIDSPIMQRLKDIHQVGLSFYVYPSARHTRFEHCLGAAIIASRIFEALLQREGGEIRTILQAVEPSQDTDKTIAQLRQDLRLAALLHDTGHSLFSHASEQVYQDLNILKRPLKNLRHLLVKRKVQAK